MRLRTLLLATLLMGMGGFASEAQNQPRPQQQQLPAPVADLFRNLTRALAEQDTERITSAFDPGMPEYRRIVGHALFLAGRGPTSSTLEIVRQSGDAGQWNVDLDWLIRAGNQAPRRGIVHVQVAQREGTWRIVAFDPIDWFAQQ